jgi:SAM-dependent methyltransferase
MRLKAKALLSGLATYVPGYDHWRPTGGTGSARYCFSVWLRHLILVRASGAVAGVPEVVAELGPGDSIGIGLAALISGAERYYALDLLPYSDLKQNLAIFDELVDLFRSRASLPGDEEFPLLLPRLGTYAFPHALLGPSWLDAALAPERIEQIRASIAEPNGPESRIVYLAPWSDAARIPTHSLDLLYSQAVLEHVDDLPGIYRTMHRWLKPGGAMSHQIDFRCHGKADTWNGHWTYSDFAWRLVTGRRAYLLNRAPRSEHIKLLAEVGFTVVSEIESRSPSALRRTDVARRFRDLSEADLTTSGTFVVAVIRA